MNIAYDMKFLKIGADVQIFDKAIIVNSEQIELGDVVKIDDFSFVCGGSITKIGSFVHIGPFSAVVGGGELIMEDFSGLSSGVRVHTGTDDFSGNSLVNPTVPAKYRQPIRSFVKICKHATVGSGSTVLPGVTIGEGAVVGANSLVTKDCDPWTVYIGSPARPLKSRPSETILKLEAQLRADLYDGVGNYITGGTR
jgi:acetyltransferase-like isoleucine patch superfamily enzyme